ncbi:MAG: hypothetical protein LBH48_00790 [Bifidobacteriaceae bacterium]|nr:hypothetical protein [Bifidobacteriaceae bacterium]
MLTPAVIGIVGVVALALGGCGGNGGSSPAVTDIEEATPSVDYQDFATLEEATQAADVIVQAEYVSSEVEPAFGAPATGASLPSVEGTAPSPMASPGGSSTPPMPSAGETGSSPVPSGGWASPSPMPVTVSTVRVTAVLKGNVEVGDSIRVRQTGGIVDGTEYIDAETVLLEDLPDRQLVLFLTSNGEDPMELISPMVGLMVAHGDRLEPAQGPDGISTSPLATSLQAIRRAVTATTIDYSR